VQFEEAFAETVGEARVPFQPEPLTEDDDEDIVLFEYEVDMVLFVTDAEGHEIVFPSEVDGQDIVLDEYVGQDIEDEIDF